ncbi:MAG: putative oxidoreductase C-terminal domain-containing protein [Alphaproteobacteria bacterium]|jgi:predicted dehydrogenase|nr:putative oxidoreductase C-terminal domain-containing protein [Alphaproteobacteria bacterium]MDP6692208.1 putative oxidoreductase C-terminal domain-containing protein [Alphaproteobacteria bacterium]MDP6816151.1 putative oxidoreductase C-terminal domain-containing protein [Alphaproteobacteria bacterium]
MTHSLLVFDPGHFHAALLLSRRNSRVDRTVHLYAPPGPDVEKFIALIESFNERQEAPTDWRLDHHIGPDALAALIAERRGGIVILAGRNGPRLALMHRLHDEGFHVLADKPWLTDSGALPHLEAITTGPPLAVDIMTGRHSAFGRLRSAVLATPSVFGALGAGTERPALEFTSRHHLLKLVGGRPLQRPAWFYDVTVQGDGLVDIQSHYVDQAQWIIAPEHRLQADRDVEIISAERWTTPVPLDLFRESTGEETFPEYLRPLVEGGQLQLACNGRIDYRLCGVRVRQHCEWGLREAVGGGDIQGFTARGETAELTIDHGPDTGFRPRMRLALDDDRTIELALGQWRAEFPGLEVRADDDGYLLGLPPASEAGHEDQFPLMLDQFLDLVDAAGWPGELAARIRCRYTLLARALDFAG